MKYFFSTTSFLSNKNKDKLRILKVQDHIKLHSPRFSFSSNLETSNSFPEHLCILKCFTRIFIFITDKNVVLQLVRDIKIETGFRLYFNDEQFTVIVKCFIAAL